MHNDHPELIKDQYWDEIFPNELPYTRETMAFKESHPMPSTANINAAVNAAVNNSRQSGKFDEMVGKSLYSVNYKFPDCNSEVSVLPALAIRFCLFKIFWNIFFWRNLFWCRSEDIFFTHSIQNIIILCNCSPVWLC